MANTSIERTEKAIRSGTMTPAPKRFRVYTLTLSQVHLLHGVDFMLYMSFDNKEDADAEAARKIAKGLELALVIDGNVEK